MADIKLICLDFDGTFMVYDETPGFMHPDVVEQLNRHGDRDIQWCTNSGREMGSQWEVLSLSRDRGLRHLPIGILARESLVFLADNGTYRPHKAWNTKARRELHKFHRALQAAMRPDLATLIRAHDPEQIYMAEDGTALCLPDGAGVEQFAAAFEDYVSGVPGGVVTRNGGWVSASPAALNKGAILAEFASERGFRPEQMLAVGDHVNDLSMLDGNIAAHVGCPADADPVVVETVRRAGGVVGRREGPLGTVDVLSHYLEA